MFASILKGDWLESDHPRDNNGKFTTDTTVYYHGSISGDLRGGKTGLHLGTREAAKQALQARIGVPAEGEWDGTREYGKTLLMGMDKQKAFEKSHPHVYVTTGINCDAPKEDYYPKEGKLTYPDGSPVLMTEKPDIRPFVLNTEMSNTRSNPHKDFKANGYMKAQLKKGTATRGYYYINDGEDSGSISVVVPNGKHIKPVERKAEMFAKIMVQKDWAAFDAMRKNPESQKAAIAKNHDVAQGLLAQSNKLKNDPEKKLKLNDYMLGQGYIPDAADNGETIYLPLTGDTKSNKLPANPVAGHKVHIVLNHKTGHVDAVSRYT